MTNLYVMLAVFCGALSLGALSILIFVLRYALAKLNETRAETEKTVACMSKVHNELAQKYLELVDQVNGHEFKLNGVKR